jgi:hypothetical protein
MGFQKDIVPVFFGRVPFRLLEILRRKLREAFANGLQAIAQVRDVALHTPATINDGLLRSELLDPSESTLGLVWTRRWSMRFPRPASAATHLRMTCTNSGSESVHY